MRQTEARRAINPWEGYKAARHIPFDDAYASTDLVGIVSWSSGPLTSHASRVCGGFTAITSLETHQSWIMNASYQLLSIGGEWRRNDAVPPLTNPPRRWWFSR